MQTKIPTLGIRFDLAKAGGESECWKIFWRAVSPDAASGALLYEGVEDGGSYCIAVQSNDPSVVESVRSLISESAEFAAVRSKEAFLEGDKCADRSYPHAGRIDAHGNLVGDAKNSRPALAAVRQEGHAAVRLAAPLEVPQRTNPASERTANLPPMLGYEHIREFLKSQFSPAIANTRDLWITPEELCDVVEAFHWILEVGIREQPSAHSENVLHIRLFDKDRHGIEPLELVGLFAFSSRSDVTSFLASHAGNPEYAEALPDLAGIAGRYQVNLSRAVESARKQDFSAEERIPAAALWPRIFARREAFGDELRQAWASVERRREAERQRQEELRLQEEEARHREEEARSRDAEGREQKREEERQRREEVAQQQRMAAELEQSSYVERRAQGRCIYCGKALGMVDKVRKADRHKDCWRFEPDAS